MKNGKLEPSESKALKDISSAMAEAIESQTQAMVKNVDVQAANRANAAKSDLSSLKRIADRLEKGYYHHGLK